MEGGFGSPGVPDIWGCSPGFEPQAGLFAPCGSVGDLFLVTSAPGRRDLERGPQLPSAKRPNVPDGNGHIRVLDRCKGLVVNAVSPARVDGSRSRSRALPNFASLSLPACLSRSAFPQSQTSGPGSGRGQE